MVTPYAGQPGELDGLHVRLIGGVLRVIAHYPSAAHEELAAKFAGSNEHTIVLHAVDTLGKIGTTDAALRAVREAMRKHLEFVYGQPDYSLKFMEADYRALVRKLAPPHGGAPPPRLKGN
jgi:hypothetical protein